MSDYNRPEAVDIDQFFNEFVDAGAFREAGEFPTQPAGMYVLQITKYEGRKEKDGRPTANLTVNVLDDSGKKKATVYTDIAWIPKRNDQTGKLDPAFRRYEQLTRALYPTLDNSARAGKQLGEVFNDMVKYPVKGYLTERFEVPDETGKMTWITPRTDDETISYRKRGYRARNGVANFSKNS